MRNGIKRRNSLNFTLEFHLFSKYISTASLLKFFRGEVQENKLTCQAEGKTKFFSLSLFLSCRKLQIKSLTNEEGKQ